MSDLFKQSSDDINPNSEWEFFIFNKLIPHDKNLKQFLTENPDLTEKIKMGEQIIEITYQNTIRFKDGSKQENDAVTTNLSCIYSNVKDKNQKYFFAVDIKNNLN